MKIIPKIPLVLLACCCIAAANGASFEVFLKIDGIEGDVTINGHEKEINVLTFNIGVLNNGTFATGGAGGGGQTKFTDLTVFKLIDKASPALFLASARGERIRSATLEVRQLGPTPFTFYRIVLSNVLISSVNNNGTTDQNGNLFEQITLNCSKMAWTFFPQNPNGSRAGPISHFFDLISETGG